MINFTLTRKSRPIKARRMKIRLYPILILISILFSIPAFSQRFQGSQQCDISNLQPAIDSVKKIYAAEGYSILREASLQMESQYEMPVIVPLSQNEWYQIIFVGDPGSRLYEVRMYDYNEREVAYKKKQWGDVDGNAIAFRYIPQFSEYHIIRPVQVNKKKKQLCGYIMLMKKTQ